MGDEGSTTARAPLQPRQAVQRMAAYVPPSSGREGHMRLDFNENTIGCSPRVLAAIKKYLTRDRMAAYPEYSSARTALAAGFGRAPEETLITNGTDEAIQLAIGTFVDAGDSVVVSEPTFAMYRFYAAVAGAGVIDVRQTHDFRFPIGAVREMLHVQSARAVFIANPNNPTATAVSAERIEGLVAEFPDTLFFVDEAYFEFCGVTMLPLIARYPNLLVSRTFSKAHGLAALRIGCLFAHRDTAVHMLKAQSPYSVNAIAIVAAMEAISDKEYVRRYVLEVMKSRAIFERELRTMEIEFVPSDSNFVLTLMGDRTGAVRDALRKRGILSRDRSYEVPGALRFTLGTRKQTRLLIAALKEVLNEVRK